MTKDDCIFSQIASGHIQATVLYQDDDVVAFEDLHPQAPVHFLVIPKKHIATLDDVTADDSDLLGKMLFAATAVGRENGIGATGYRQGINCRAAGGQVVFHLHLHIMGGRDMGAMG